MSIIKLHGRMAIYQRVNSEYFLAILRIILYVIVPDWTVS